MKAVTATDFPELRKVFSGYLHEDALVEYGTAAAALRAYREDANAVEHRRFRLEAVRFLAYIEAASLNEVRALMSALGSRWVPPSRKALIAFLTDVTTAD